MHRANKNRWFFFIMLALVVLVTVPGCRRAPAEPKQEIDKTPYLGTWECVGIQMGDHYQSLEDYESSSGETYTATMVLRDNGFAYLLEEKNGNVSSEVEEWLEEEIKPVEEDGMVVDSYRTGDFVFSGYLEMRDARLYKPVSKNKTLVFDKVSDSLEPLLRSVQQPGCTIEVPIELAEDYDWKVENLGGVESIVDSPNAGLEAGRGHFRDNSSALLLISHEYKGRDDHPEGEEVTIDGNVFYISPKASSVDERNSVKVQFILPGQQPYESYIYKVTFSYNSEDAVYYENYANSFLERLHIGNEVMPDAVAVADSSGVVTPNDGGYEDGPISWKDAPQHVGEYVEVFGTVAETNFSPESDGQPTFIDIGEPYPSPNRVTAVIWGEDRGNFPEPPEDMYDDRYIKVEGELYLRDGVCNIRVSSPSQIVAR